MIPSVQSMSYNNIIICQLKVYSGVTARELFNSRVNIGRSFIKLSTRFFSAGYLRFDLIGISSTVKHC